MVTREELKQYRDMVRELREKRALMLQAERAARESDRESDKRRAEDLAKRYEKTAALRAAQTERIAAEKDCCEHGRVRVARGEADKGGHRHSCRKNRIAKRVYFGILFLFYNAYGQA